MLHFFGHFYPQNSIAYLPLLFFLILLSEHGMNPPNLSEHAAISQAEPQPQQPQAELEEHIMCGYKKVK